MKGRFFKIKRDLKTALEQQLLADIYSYREERLARIQRIIDTLTNPADSPSGREKLRRATEAGIKQLKEFAGASEYQNIVDVIIGDILTLKKEFPPREVLRNVPERFRIFQDDSFFVKIGKLVKQLVRTAGKDEWLQRIPVQDVLVYHLLDADWLYREWMAAEERLSLQIILELNQVLAHALEGREKFSHHAELKQVLKVIQNHIEEARREHKQKLGEARDTFVELFIEDYAKVGTFERRNSFYNKTRIQQKQEQTKTELQDYLKEWQQVNSQLLERTTALFQVYSLSGELKEASKKAGEDIHAIFEQFFLQPYGKLKQQIGPTGREPTPPAHDLFTISGDHQQQSSDQTGPSVLEFLREGHHQIKIQDRINLYVERFSGETDALAEKIIYVVNINRKKDPPGVESKRIDWRRIVSRALKEKYLNIITAEESKFEEFNEKQLSEAREIIDIIETNVETVSELNRNKSARENSDEIIEKGMQRAAAKLEQCIAQVHDMENALLSPLREGPAAFEHYMLSIIYHADAKKLKALDAASNTEEETGQKTAKVNAIWERLKHRSAVIGRFLRKKGSHYLEEGKEYVGQKTQEIHEEKQADITDFLKETERRLSELPYIYRQLFSVKELAEKRFYVSVDENFTTLRQAWEQWHDGRGAACAIIGEKGSGKATYMKLARQDFFNDKPYVHFKLDQTYWAEQDLVDHLAKQMGGNSINTIDDLIEILNEQQHGTTILLEQMHNLYLRFMSGYEGIEQLIYLISETSENIFWVTTCSRYAWSFLDRVSDLGQYFSAFVEADRLNEEQMQRLILQRHRSSGYDLIFEASESILKTKQFRDMDDEQKKQDQLKEEFFEELVNRSEGNASIAMLFWLRSIRDIDDTHVHVAPPEDTSKKLLDDLQSATAFVLAALVMHDMLMPEELSLALGMEKRKSKLILNRLKTKGILSADDNSMSINQLMYRQVIRELKERNILHLE